MAPAFDNHPLYTRVWLPGEEPVGVLVLAHGLAEHGGVYGELAKKAHPGVPLFLLGHSMGSIMARCYAIENSQQLAGSRRVQSCS